jgi:hypothetical protein
MAKHWARTFAGCSPVKGAADFIWKLSSLENQPVDKNSWNMFTAAKNRLASLLSTSPAVLKHLGRTGNKSVRQRVGENPSSDSQTLDGLSKDGDSNVRSAVAGNPSTSGATAEFLSVDENADVRYAMAENHKTSESLLKQLATDDNPYVKDRAERTQARNKSENETDEA